MCSDGMREGKPHAFDEIACHRGSLSDEDRGTLLDAVHDVMVAVFGVPSADRYQILTEHAAANLRALDTGLGFKRTHRFVLIEVVSRPRPKEQKVEFYRRLAETLASDCGVAQTDLMITFVINSDEDWSFGNGEAQFLSGSLS